MFSALAENKNNIRDKISAFAALAPVASFSQQSSVKYDDGLKTSLWKTVDEFTKNNIYEFGPTIKLEDFTYLKHVPGMKTIFDAIAETYVATKEIYHYDQLELSKEFQKYDYSLYDEGITNQEKYGQDTPPKLPLD